MKRMIIAALAALITAPAIASQPDDVGSMHYANAKGWEVRRIDGDFCMAFSPFPDHEGEGTYLSFSAGREGSVSMLLGDEDWKLRPGEDIVIAYQSRNDSGTMTAKVGGSGTTIMFNNLTEYAVRDLMRVNVIRFSRKGAWQATFSMRGSHAAWLKTIECAMS